MIYQYLLKIILVIFLLLLIIVLCNKFYKKLSIENFDDKFEENEKYDEIYDKEFVDLYEIIYRDFSDIDHDLKIVYEKIIDNIKDKNAINILVCGCGIGKLCKKIKEKHKNVIGVDISYNMLMKAQHVYPNVKFIRGNIIKKQVFQEKSFSHIFLEERTLYYNSFEDMKKIIQNTLLWLKDKGFLIVQIYDPNNLQLAARYYSSKYIDSKGYVHGFTYLNDFSHDCYYIRDDSDKEKFNYYDKIVLDDGKKRIKKTTFNIPDKEKMYDLILSNGFDIFYIEKIRRQQVVGGYELAIFRKKNTKITVDELQNK
jgi:ubiquinone/menaquinone biosynthesis C-methylase UbiE